MSEGKSRKIYYTMGEVAEMLDVNITTVRFWESRFSIIKPHRNKKGNRLFTATDIENLKLIYMLVKEQGMTLDGAEKALSDNRDEILRKAEIIDRLLSVKSMLLEIKQELWSDDHEYIDPQDEYEDIQIITQTTPSTDTKQETQTNNQQLQSPAQSQTSTEQTSQQDSKNNTDYQLDSMLNYESSPEIKEQTLF